MGPSQKFRLGRRICFGRDLTQMLMWVARLMGIVPRCMCVGYPGIPMYFARVAFQLRLIIKRRPGTGPLHASSCPSHGYSSLPSPLIPPVVILRFPPIPVHSAAFIEGLYAAFAVVWAVIRFPAKW